MHQNLIDIWQTYHDEVSVLIALGLIVIAIMVRHKVVGSILHYIHPIIGRMSARLDDVLTDLLRAPLGWLWVLLAAQFAVRVIDPVYRGYSVVWLESSFVIVFAWAMVKILAPLADFFGGKYIHVGGQQLRNDVLSFLVMTLKILVICLALATLLETWGVSVTAFLGGLGLVGMAVALAAKDSVQNVFAGLMIVFSRLFEQGDWIKTDHVEGTVEKIGLRMTEIRQFNDALVTIPNSQLADVALINWSRMRRRRVKMDIGLEYGTSAKQMETVIKNLRDYIKKSKDIDHKTTEMVHFTCYGDSAIVINLYYFTKTTVWKEWRQIVHDHILVFKKIVEDAGADFAFPSQTMYFRQDGSALSANDTVAEAMAVETMTSPPKER